MSAHEHAAAEHLGRFVAAIGRGKADALIEIETRREGSTRRGRIKRFNASDLTAMRRHLAQASERGESARARAVARERKGADVVPAAPGAAFAHCRSPLSQERLRAFGLAPHVAVETAGGIEAFWAIEDLEDLTDLIEVNARLARELGAEPAGGAPGRFVALPGAVQTVRGERREVRVQSRGGAPYDRKAVLAALPTAGPASSRADAYGDPLERIAPPEYAKALGVASLGPGGGALRCDLPGCEDTEESLEIEATVTEGWRCRVCERGGGPYELAGAKKGLLEVGERRALDGAERAELRDELLRALRVRRRSAERERVGREDGRTAEARPRGEPGAAPALTLGAGHQYPGADPEGDDPTPVGAHEGPGGAGQADFLGASAQGAGRGETNADDAPAAGRHGALAGRAVGKVAGLGRLAFLGARTAGGDASAAAGLARAALPVALSVASVMAGMLALIVAAAFLLSGYVNPAAGKNGTCYLADKAKTQMPQRYFELYQEAGEEYGIDSAVLASIGEIESAHGQGTAPGIKSGANFAGCCGGPMQFYFVPGAPVLDADEKNSTTWGAYAVDGDGDGDKDVHDPEDAIPSAANYLTANLKESGWKKGQSVDEAPNAFHNAIFAYNHAEWYVQKVLAGAEKYRGECVPGEQAAGDISCDGGQASVMPGGDRPGTPTKEYVVRYVACMSAIWGRPVKISTGTNHNQFTVYGGQSEHWIGDAADLGAGANGYGVASEEGNRLASACLQVAGVDKARADQLSRTSTGFGRYTHNGYSIQCLWRVSGHFDHTHVGLHPVGR